MSLQVRVDVIELPTTGPGFPPQDRQRRQVASRTRRWRGGGGGAGGAEYVDVILAKGVSL